MRKEYLAVFHADIILADGVGLQDWIQRGPRHRQGALIMLCKDSSTLLVQIIIFADT
jgi:hypothetical protein